MSVLPFDDRDGFIWYDGRLVPWRDAKLHVLTHGLHYASCVFEGERVYGGKGRAPSTCAYAFVSSTCADRGFADSYRLAKKVEAVRDCRALGKKDMKLNDATPIITVDGTSVFGPVVSPIPRGEAAARLWDGVLLLAGAVAGLGLLRPVPALRGAAAVAVAAGLAALSYAVAAVVDSGPLTLSGALRVLVGTQPWPLLCGIAALAAGWYAARAKPAADLALGLTGACLALYAGAANAAVFVHAVPPVALPGTVARLLVLVSLSAGAGLAAVAVLRMRAAARPATAVPKQRQNSMRVGTLPS